MGKGGCGWVWVCVCVGVCACAQQERLRAHQENLLAHKFGSLQELVFTIRVIGQLCLQHLPCLIKVQTWHIPTDSLCVSQHHHCKSKCCKHKSCMTSTKGGMAKCHAATHQTRSIDKTAEKSAKSPPAVHS